MKSKRQFGFTLVELIVIIAVIGILASVAVVSYIGTQERSKDSAIESEATTLSQSARAQYEIRGTYGYGATPPATKTEALSAYNATSLDKRVHVVSIDPASEHGDREKIHVVISPNSLIVGYWSYEKDAWVYIQHRGDGIIRYEHSSPPSIIL